MRKFIISLLGGFTQQEKAKAIQEAKSFLIELHDKEVHKLKSKVFRSGDPVFITNGKSSFTVGDMYYLLEPYNGGYYWYISKDPNDKQRREMSNGVSVDNISHDPPEKCPHCQSIINNKTE